MVSGQQQWGQQQGRPPQQPWSQQPTAQQPTGRGQNNGRKKGIKVLALLGVFLLGGCMGRITAPSGDSTTTPAPRTTVTVTAQPGTSTPAAAAASPTATLTPTRMLAKTFGDGTWLVDTDINPGTYQAVAESSCTWVRLSDTSGSSDAIIAGDNVAQGARAVVTISSSDAAFKSKHCGKWTLIK